MNKGLDKLYATLNGTLPQSSLLNYDDEGELLKSITSLEYININKFQQDDSENHARIRARIRYIAALFPTLTHQQLVPKIYMIINNTNMAVEDLSLILQGRKLSDPSRKTNEVPLKIIQGIGQCLQSGMNISTTSTEMRVSYDTVEAIEAYLGLRKAYKMRELDKAVDAVRHGVSIRKFATELGISRTKSKTLLEQGKKILKEIGE